MHAESLVHRPAARRFGALILDSSTYTGTLILDRSGMVLYASPVLATVFGRASDQLAGLAVETLLSGFVLPAADFAVTSCGDEDTRQVLALSADGTKVRIAATCTPLGAGTSALLVVEVGGVRSQSNGGAEIEGLAWALEQSADAVMITAPDGVIEYVNPAFEVMTGFTRDETVGRTPALLKSGHNATDVYATLWDTLQAGKEFRAVMLNRRKSGELFHMEEFIRPFRDPSGQVTHWVSMGRDVSERMRKIESLTHAATHDALTGLPNRALFFDRLGQATRHAARRGASCMIAIVDLDRFKPVNDSLGHLVGDAVLRIAATRLKSCIREADTAARLGGDEFGLILVDTGSSATPAPVLQKIVAAFATPMGIEDHSLVLTVSVGACTYPQDAADVHELLHRADEAMYRAKRLGGNRFCLFADSPHSGADRKVPEPAQRRGTRRRRG